MKSDIRLKRIYESASAEDGYRVLVDRLWPRGISKEKSQIDLWLKEVAPETELRKWYNHEPAKWAEFRRCYFTWLDARPQTVQILIDKAAEGSLTLLYSSRETERNQAVALKAYLLSKSGK
jgi:uncharacterized protein YeaO (DUF488 family)